MIAADLGRVARVQMLDAAGMVLHEGCASLAEDGTIRLDVATEAAEDAFRVRLLDAEGTELGVLPTQRGADFDLGAAGLHRAFVDALAEGAEG